ncbi:hypothetical protein D9M72_564160 [compost metagenome]
MRMQRLVLQRVERAAGEYIGAAAAVVGALDAADQQDFHAGGRVAHDQQAGGIAQQWRGSGGGGGGGGGGGRACAACLCGCHCVGIVVSCGAAPAPGADSLAALKDSQLRANPEAAAGVRDGRLWLFRPKALI